jgi:hypothetical protein
MLFLHDLAAQLTAAVAAEKRPDLEKYIEPQDGEKVLGFIFDPQCLALIALRDDEDSGILRRAKPRPRQKNAMAGPLRAMNQSLQLELQRAFADWEDIPLGIRRKGNGLVVVRSGKKGPAFLQRFSFFEEPATRLVGAANARA